MHYSISSEEFKATQQRVVMIKKGSLKCITNNLAHDHPSLDVTEVSCSSKRSNQMEIRPNTRYDKSININDE